MSAAVLSLACVYFGVVFAAGFVLGVLRTLWLVPRLGERAAELAELPVMLVVIVLTAKLAVGHWRDQLTGGAALLAGGVALLLLLSLELTVVLSLRGLTLAEYLAARDPVSGTAYAFSLALFALMPLAVFALGGRRE